jgi:hypothetical protein
MMICLMPFTYIEADRIAVITGALGPVAVCGLIPEIVPDHMRPWAQKQVLSLQYPQGELRADDLKRSMAEFKAWADMHHGNIGDMIVFHKTMNGHAPFVDETHPTQIGNQIRHFAEPSVLEAADPLYKSALFLFMAQEHDRQQEAVRHDLGAVQAMEQAMLARLSGRAGQVEQALSEESPSAAVPIHNPDIGAYMTSRRVQAWARLTDSREPVCSTYVTTSPAVYAFLLDKFPEAGNALVLKPGTLPNQSAGDAGLGETLEALSQPQHPGGVPPATTEILPTGAGIADLTLSPLVGMPPGAFLDRLCGWPSKAAQAAADGKMPPLSTVIGLLNLA